MAIRPSIRSSIRIIKGNDTGVQALTKRFVGPSHTKDFKNGSVPCLHGIQHEVGTMKHNWSAQCQFNVTGWVSMLA